jgi:hypothetical protein
LPPLAGQQVAERETSDRYPLELMDLVTEPREHPADFAVLALVEHHLENGALAVLGADRHPFRVHFSLGQPHPLPQLAEQVFRGNTRDLHEVFFFHAVAGMREEVGERTIVGQQDQALAHAVEPSHGEQAVITRDEIDDPRPSGRIDVGRDDADRLVQQVHDTADLGQPLTIDPDFLRPRIDAGAEFGHHDPIDLDAARRDQFLARAAAAEAGRRQHFLQPFEAVVGHDWA